VYKFTHNKSSICRHQVVNNNSTSNNMSVRKQVSEVELPQTVKFVNSALQLIHSLQYNNSEATSLLVRQSYSILNCLPGAAFANLSLPHSQNTIPCPLIYTILYKIILNFVAKVCVHYANYSSCSEIDMSWPQFVFPFLYKNGEYFTVI